MQVPTETMSLSTLRITVLISTMEPRIFFNSCGSCMNNPVCHITVTKRIKQKVIVVIFNSTPIY